VRQPNIFEFTLSAEPAGFRTCCSLLVANHYRRPSNFAIHILLLAFPERSSSRRIPVAINGAAPRDGKF
jgi:hypothetical protein